MCTEEIGGFLDVIYHQLLALRVLCAGCYRISIVLAFLCGLKKTIRIRYEWTRIFWTTEGKNSPSSKISQYVCKGPKIVKISCLFFVSSFRSFQRPLQISLRFHTPEAWKWYPFRLEPPRMGHYRDTPPPGKTHKKFLLNWQPAENCESARSCECMLSLQSANFSWSQHLSNWQYDVQIK